MQSLIFMIFQSSGNSTSVEDFHKQQQIASHRKILAKTLTTSLWKLSHINIFQWNPAILEEAMKSVFSNLTAPDVRPDIRKKIIRYSSNS